jgi:hypothetical protein
LDPPVAEFPPVPLEPILAPSLLQPETENNETAIVANIRLFVMAISQLQFSSLYRLCVLITPTNIKDRTTIVRRFVAGSLALHRRLLLRRSKCAFSYLVNRQRTRLKETKR